MGIKNILKKIFPMPTESVHREFIKIQSILDSLNNKILALEEKMQKDAIRNLDLLQVENRKATDELKKEIQKNQGFTLKNRDLLFETQFINKKATDEVKKEIQVENRNAADEVKKEIQVANRNAADEVKKEIQVANRNAADEVKKEIQDENRKTTDEVKKEIQVANRKTTDEVKEVIIEAQREIKNNKSVIVSTVAKTLKRQTIEHLDFHLTEHCNLNCKGCSTFAPLATEHFADPKVFKNDLTQLHKLVGDSIQQIHLMGGEPLLHPDIEQFAVICRSIFSDARIDFTTNGLLIFNMPSSFWDVLKEQSIAIKYTRYPVNFDYDMMIKYIEEKGISVFSAGGEIKYFRRIPLNADGTFNLYQSYVQCPYTDCPQLRDGKLYRCPACGFVDILNNAMKTNSQNKEFHTHTADCLDIYKTSGKEDVKEFLSSPIPFCQYCDMNNTDSKVIWGASNHDIKEWVDV